MLRVRSSLRADATVSNRRTVLKDLLDAEAVHLLQ